MLINDLLFDENGIVESLKGIILPYWNSCNFFISYANIDGYHPDVVFEPKPEAQLDKWVLAKLYNTEKAIRENMDKYQIDRYVESIIPMIDGLTNWYIRRSRRRYWGKGLTEDKKQAYDTLYYVLVKLTQLMAPITPFIAEIYNNLVPSELSVHLSDWPVLPDCYADEELLAR